MIDRERLELALAVAAHERVADKVGRSTWHPVEAMRRIAEPDGYAFDPSVNAVPVEFAEWCWPTHTFYVYT